VSDNALWGSTGPIGGSRSRWSFETGIGDLSYHTFVADARRYQNVRHDYALCARLIGAVSQGDDPQFFRIGGAYTLRGWPYGEFRGTRIGLANLEFRFPLIDYLKIGFPLPVTLGGIRGVTFLDAGAAWNDTDRFRAIRTRKGITHLDDVRASYGFGARMNVGFTVLRWDLAWRTDLARTSGPARGFLSLGLDF
jgi:outer membrane protein assembly factor BamA